ncbi:MAG TPA: hypothetical protein VGG03_04080 [Thermoanaerobaculia bacterium]
MKLRTAALAAFALALAFPCSSAFAKTRGTPAEAKAMLQKAVAHYKSAGRKQALSDFTAGKRRFVIATCMSSASRLTTQWLPTAASLPLSGRQPILFATPRANRWERRFGTRLPRTLKARSNIRW